MKSRSFAVVMASFVCMLLLSGVAMAQGGQLVRAEWGVPGAQVDVTAQVRGLIRGGVLQFEVTRFNLGIDPAPHQNKVLVLHIRHWDGDIKDYSYPERSMVNMELDPEDRWERRDDRRDEAFGRREHGVHILRAYYGAEGQFINVTDAVRSHIDDGRLFMHVDNYNLGGDPLPGRRKWLRVLYIFHGERRNVVVEEKTDLQLP